MQFRYMSSSTAVADFTNTANWQGVDDEPTAGSDNLVKSGGIFDWFKNFPSVINISHEIQRGGYYVLSSPSNKPVFVSDNMYYSASFNAKEGEVYKISGYGGNSARLWAITDINDNIIIKADLNTQVHENDAVEVLVPSGGTKLYYNSAAGTTIAAGYERTIKKINVINRLDSESDVLPLSALMGKIINTKISGINSFISSSRNFVFDVSSNTDVNKALKEAILDAQFILSKPEWWDNSMHVTFETREYTGVFSVTVSQMLSETNGFVLKIYTENNYSYVPYFILGNLRRYKKLHDDIWVYRSFKTIAKTDDDEDITLEALVVVDESKLYDKSGVFPGNRFVANTVRYRHSGLLEAYNIASGTSYFVEFSTINFGVSGDSITVDGQWANVVNSILSFNTIHNTAVGSARYACRQYTVDGVTYETQDYNDPDFVGISDGWDYTTDVLEIRKRLNNCAKVHIQKFINEVANNDYPSPDIFALAYSTNDSVPTSENTTNACSESSLSDVDLFNLAGGLRWCLETIRTTYPICKIFVLLPIQRAGNLSSSGNANNIEKIQAIRKVCQAMSVPVINMFDECGICGILENGTGPYLRDGLHPNANGQALMGRYAANYIRNWYNKLV